MVVEWTVHAPKRGDSIITHSEIARGLIKLQIYQGPMNYEPHLEKSRVTKKLKRSVSHINYW